MGRDGPREQLAPTRTPVTSWLAIAPTDQVVGRINEIAEAFAAICCMHPLLLAHSSETKPGPDVSKCAGSVLAGHDGRDKGTTMQTAGFPILRRSAVHATCAEDAIRGP
jgi:hypothetical protein